VTTDTLCFVISTVVAIVFAFIALRALSGGRKAFDETVEKFKRDYFALEGKNRRLSEEITSFWAGADETLARKLKERDDYISLLTSKLACLTDDDGLRNRDGGRNDIFLPAGVHSEKDDGDVFCDLDYIPEDEVGGPTSEEEDPSFPDVRGDWDDIAF